MTDLRTAAQQALEALKIMQPEVQMGEGDAAITALKAALAEPVQEPVGYLPAYELDRLQSGHDGRLRSAKFGASVLDGDVAVYTAPPQRPADPVQEPVAWRFEARHIDTAWGSAVSLKHPGPEGVYMRNVVPLYAAPPQRPAEPVQEPQCNPHPKAPHSFMRNASHTEDRYVCECEGWEPYEAGYQAGMEAALRAQS